MMLRRDFLRRLVATSTGLLVADDALELLTHRKVWAGHDFTYGQSFTKQFYLVQADINRAHSRVSRRELRQFMQAMHESMKGYDEAFRWQAHA